MKDDDANKLLRLGLAVGRVLEAHDKAASEFEPGFSCGCKTVCQPLTEALIKAGLTTRRYLRQMEKSR